MKRQNRTGPCRHASFESILGRGFVAACGGKVFAVEFCPEEEEFLARTRARYGVESRSDPGSLATVVGQIEEYFGGRRKRFSVEVEPLAGSPFERRVWKKLAEVPWGKTVSYGELARRAGSPGAARAVGRAMARNPVSIILPCHRVIRSDGSTGGFGLGTEAKQALLELEGVLT
jgi:O-6-methylguanine DNA methyltransferase